VERIEGASGVDRIKGARSVDRIKRVNCLRVTSIPEK
jgi:hypothetical protein